MPELKFTESIRRMPAVTWWSQVAWVSALVDHDLVTQGRDPLEAKEALTEAVQLMVKWSLKDGGAPWEALDKHDTLPASVEAMRGFKAKYAEAIDFMHITHDDVLVQSLVSKEQAYKFEVVVGADGTTESGE